MQTKNPNWTRFLLHVLSWLISSLSWHSLWPLASSICHRLLVGNIAARLAFSRMVYQQCVHSMIIHVHNMGVLFYSFFYCFFILFSSFLSYSNIWCSLCTRTFCGTHRLSDLVELLWSSKSQWVPAHCSCSAASNAPKDRKKERKERKRNNLISPLNLLKWSWCAMGRRVEGSKGCSKGREMQAHPYCTPIPCWIDRCEAERCGDVDSAKH